MGFRISVKAAKDIEDIWLYTVENWSATQADRYVNQLFDEIEYLAENPKSGRDYSHVRKNYRCSKINSHLIFYREAGKDEIEIIRILHQSMDIPNRFGD